MSQGSPTQKCHIAVLGGWPVRGPFVARSWFVAAGVLEDWDRFYDALISIGRQSRDISEVVLRFDDGGWIPYFCTDSNATAPNATIRDILEAAADRNQIMYRLDLDDLRLMPSRN